MPADTLFVGLGSDQGDDRAGWLAAQELIYSGTSEFAVRHARSPLDILDWLSGVRRLGICDACRGAGPVGTWRRWVWPQAELPVVHASGSHDLGLTSALHLAAQLGTLPEEVLIWGIEILSSEPGRAISPEVAAAIPGIASDVATTFASGSRCGHQRKSPRV
jgi:hydrogenase maturation protease